MSAWTLPWFVELLWPLAIIAVAYTVLGITGFGSALISVPLLAWKWPLPEVVALVLLLDAPASAVHGGVNFKQVDKGDLLRLLPGMVLGCLVGWWLSSVLQAKWPLLLLGAYVVGVGLNALRAGAAPPKPVATVWAGPAGFAIGVVEMMFGTAGPVVMAWLRRRLANVQVLRATVPVVMVVATLAVLLNMGAVGRLADPGLWQRFLLMLPVAVLGVLLGNRLVRFIPAAQLRRAIFVLLVASGLMLMWRAFRI